MPNGGGGGENAGESGCSGHRDLPALPRERSTVRGGPRALSLGLKMSETALGSFS